MPSVKPRTVTSPVSDIELSEITSPKDEPPLPPQPAIETLQRYGVKTPPLPSIECPAPPPPPNEPKPPSPLTSPIGSSPDDLEAPTPEPSGDAVAAFSQSVMAADLRTPRQMMQLHQSSHQVQRAAPSGTPTPEHTQSSVSASDISDTDLPEASGAGTQSEEETTEGRTSKSSAGQDLENLEEQELESTRAALQAKLAATKLSDSDGEVNDSDSDDAYMKKFQEICHGATSGPDTTTTGVAADTTAGPSKEDSSMSPISSEAPSPVPPKKDEPVKVEDDHTAEKADYEMRDDDKDEGGGVGGGGGSSTSQSTALGFSSRTDSSRSHGTDVSRKESKKDEHGSTKHQHKSHHSSSSSKQSHHSSSNHHSSRHKSSSSKDHRRSSHDSSTNEHKHGHYSHHRDKDRKHSSSSSSKREHDTENKGLTKGEHRSARHHDGHGTSERHKETKREMEKKREQKLKSCEEKVNQTYKLKSDKYAAIDMFAPKPQKMPMTPLQRQISSGTGR